MDRRRTKTMVSRLLRQSILELCKASVPQEQGIEIDGIVCISIGSDDEQIVVKVHEQMGTLRTISHATSSQSHPGNRVMKLNGEKASETSPSMDYKKKRQNLHSIASLASAKKMKISGPGESEESVGSTSTSIKKTNVPSQSAMPDLSLLAAIKTEVLSDEDVNDTSLPQAPQTSGMATNSNMEKYLGNASLDTLVFRDLECEHCKLLLPTFEDLKTHNDTEHKANTCGYCWRSFLNYGNYQQHLRTHRKMRVGGREVKEPAKDTQHKHKKCGECQESFRSFSLIIEHLRSAHDFEKCLSCSTCDEYFPNRQTFIEHRKQFHADVQQCRCENCEVYFTYVEFKHHERECFSAEPMYKRPIQQRSKQHPAESSAPSRPDEDDQSESASVDAADQSETNVRELQLEEGNVLGQILQSEHSILEQTKALVSVKSKGNKSNDEDANKSGEECEGEMSENGESGEASAGETSMVEADTSLVDGEASAILNSLVASAVQQVNKAGAASWDPSFSQQQSSAITCQGPYRCQTCYFVVEKFEDFERHCFEMHSRYVCTYCAQTFANRRNLMRHIRRHIGDMPYECNECGQRFYRDDNLRRHKLKHLTSIRFVCAYCNLPCETKNKLTSHLIGGHAIDVMKVTEEEMMKHITLKDNSCTDSPDVSLDVLGLQPGVLNSQVS